MARTFKRPMRRSSKTATALACLASLMLPAGVAAADEPVPSGRSEQSDEVAVGLPPVPVETVPDAAPATPAPAPESVPDPTPTPAATPVRVAVGKPPVPQRVTPDASTLSLW